MKSNSSYRINCSGEFVEKNVFTFFLLKPIDCTLDFSYLNQFEQHDSVCSFDWQYIFHQKRPRQFGRLRFRFHPELKS